MRVRRSHNVDLRTPREVNLGIAKGELSLQDMMEYAVDHFLDNLRESLYEKVEQAVNGGLPSSSSRRATMYGFTSSNDDFSSAFSTLKTLVERYGVSYVMDSVDSASPIHADDSTYAAVTSNDWADISRMMYLLTDKVNRNVKSRARELQETMGFRMVVDPGMHEGDMTAFASGTRTGHSRVGNLFMYQIPREGNEEGERQDRRPLFLGEVTELGLGVSTGEAARAMEQFGQAASRIVVETDRQIMSLLYGSDSSAEPEGVMSLDSLPEERVETYYRTLSNMYYRPEEEDIEEGVVQEKPNPVLPAYIPQPGAAPSSTPTYTMYQPRAPP